jgi:hypothetical protein
MAFVYTQHYLIYRIVQNVVKIMREKNPKMYQFLL